MKIAFADKLGKFLARTTRIQHRSLSFERTQSISNPGTKAVHVEHSSVKASEHSANASGKSETSSILLSTKETELVDILLRRTLKLVNASSSNVIAYSGGVDSSLAAALVQRVFTDKTSGNPGSFSSGSVTAVLGLSPAVPPEQIETARSVAAVIGVDLLEVSTQEGTDPTYVANKGQACLACKTHLYSALNAVAAAALDMERVGRDGSVILYNGTNADDTKDPTRLGLVAASKFRVESPLLHTTKSDVRRAAKHLGLPNWNHAAAPCLRSRLAFGVEATRKHLEIVGEAERRVRKALKLDHSANMRVRYLAGKRAMVEVDERVLRDIDAESVLQHEGFSGVFSELGFESYGVRAFKSGSVAAVVVEESIGAGNAS
eukprot:CAMPEP_0113548652 /NCGR_PEP_ID=MMETSP0015_2-20120614/13006_1 /TAXON_ID=2838 /ORGANISM="Odontella" /LENGTH=375 /DNA_ID=CAMNT_0000449293 /DNA_START=266 /DNA_END=1393 /DNA_ORIENTATION=+ /assembly_acc=CAM_ASM_000160